MAQDDKEILDKIKASFDEDRSSLVSRKISHRKLHQVPEIFKKLNSDVFSPKLVALGPFSHKVSHLIMPASYKVTCCKDFFRRNDGKMEYLINLFVDKESKLKAFYADSSCYETKNFLEMMLIDCVFVADFFLKVNDSSLRTSADKRFFDNEWLLDLMVHDLMLCENQLPFKYLRRIFMLECRSVALVRVILSFLKRVGHVKHLPVSLPNDIFNPKHILGLLYSFHVVKHAGHDTYPTIGLAHRNIISSATQLQEIGIQFERGSSTSLAEFKFSSETGISVPSITVNQFTEVLYWNLIAHEFVTFGSKNILSYMVLMGNLVRSTEDVKKLIGDHRLKNEVGSHEIVVEDDKLKKEILVTEVGSYDNVVGIFKSFIQESFSCTKAEFTFLEFCIHVRQYESKFSSKIKRCTTILFQKRFKSIGFLFTFWSALFSNFFGIALVVLAWFGYAK